MEKNELVAIARPIVWRRGYQAGLSIEDRQDLFQDVLMKYLQAWPDGDAPANVAAWLETAASNAIVDRVRADQRRPADNFAEGEEDPVSLAMAVMRSTQFASAPAVSREVIDNLFALVSAEQAHLLRRRYIQNYTAAEVAAELGVSVANLDQRTTRAKRELREALSARPDLVAALRNPHPNVY